MLCRLSEVERLSAIYFGEFESVLTQDKGHRGWALDEGFGDALTQIRGYPNNEHESAQ